MKSIPAPSLVVQSFMYFQSENYFSYIYSLPSFLSEFAAVEIDLYVLYLSSSSVVIHVRALLISEARSKGNQGKVYHYNLQT